MSIHTRRITKIFTMKKTVMDEERPYRDAIRPNSKRHRHTSRGCLWRTAGRHQALALSNYSMVCTVSRKRQWVMMSGCVMVSGTQKWAHELQAFKHSPPLQSCLSPEREWKCRCLEKFEVFILTWLKIWPHSESRCKIYDACETQHHAL